jgi:hypothetical protein
VTFAVGWNKSRSNSRRFSKVRRSGAITVAKNLCSFVIFPPEFRYFNQNVTANGFDASNKITASFLPAVD